MRRLGFAAVLSVLLLCFGFSHVRLWDLRASRSAPLQADHVPPAPFLRLLSFGYEGIVSDQLFLKLITYFGEHILNGIQLTEEDWDYFQGSIDAVTELDPYFQDPYFLTQGFLAWEAKRVEAANTILAKGANHRKEDWRLPFFVGFNFFYFLEDYKQGASWIMRAAGISGSPSYLPKLASRLSYYGGDARTGIAFLQEFREQVTEPILRAAIDRRLEALVIAADLEIAVAAFKDQFGRLPKPKELVEKGFVEKIPPDPYGGEWGILKNGRVFSTSKFTNLQKSSELDPLDLPE